MGKIVDLSNKKFGMLTVISYVYSKNRHAYWLCKCECGKSKITNSSQLRSGKVKSCGCLIKITSLMKYKDYTNKKFNNLRAIKFVKRERNVTFWMFKCDCGNETVLNINGVVNGHIKNCGCKRSIRCKKSATDHGLSDTRLYRIFRGMKTRCYNANSKDYNRYRARGINICKEWLENFTNFYNWSMSNGYKDDLTIDRIDFNGNYCPDNCRWVDLKIQNNNRCSNKFITFDNKTYTISEWSEIINIPRKILEYRLRNFDSIDKAFKTSIRHRNTGILYNNKIHSLKEWSEILNIKYSVLIQRINTLKWPVEKAFSTPLRHQKKQNKGL